MLSSFTLIRLGAAQKATHDPAQSAHCSRGKRSSSGKIDTLKYQKAAMSEDEYKSQLTAALIELAKVQEELDK